MLLLFVGVSIQAFCSSELEVVVNTKAQNYSNCFRTQLTKKGLLLMTYIKKKQKSRTLITSALLCIISLLTIFLP